MPAELYIQKDKQNIYIPIVEGEITLQQEWKGVPSKLTFTVVKDDIISFPEGCPVALYVDGKGVFMGYVFTKTRDKNHRIQCVAYDQLRYLKNKATYAYINKTASDLVKMIASDYNFETGTIENTGFTIAQRIRENETMFDIIQDALDLTLDNNNKLFLLYDDFGKLTLKNIENMQVNVLIDNETLQNFDYSTSIDDDTYNSVLLIEEVTDENGQTKRVIYTDKDDETMAKWGTLLYSEEIQGATNGQAFASAILKLKNRKTRKLTLRGCLGDLSVRAGCSLPVDLYLGDVQAKNLRSRFVCESVTHTFKADTHFMDITIGDYEVGQ